MPTVFYLCRSPDNSNEFVFANELPEDYYSPGLFVVQSVNPRGLPLQEYTFFARQGMQRLRLNLMRSKDGRAYVVDADINGIFYFKIIRLGNNERYTGSRTRVFNDTPLYRLEPANMMQLERACIERDFYFVGSSGGKDDAIDVND